MKRQDIVFAFLVLASGLGAQTAGEAMKNVQVLKDVPVSAWDETMSYMGAALGVGCQHCHQGAMEGDHLKAKQTARSMIQMVREINEKNFDGRLEVTCNTCHQGNVRPKAMSIFGAATDRGTPSTPATPASSNAQALPDAGQVWAAYRKAVAADGVKSVLMKGTFTSKSQPPAAVEIEMSLPDKFLLHATVSGSEVRQVINGDRGWALAQGRTIDMTLANLARAKRSLAGLYPLKFADADAPRKTTGVEKIGDRSYTVVESHSATRLERLFFDTQSGLLSRRYAEVQTVLGSSPMEMLFDDYRGINGVKLPYLMTIGTANERVEYRFSEIQTNVAMDPARFEPPAPAEKK